MRRALLLVSTMALAVLLTAGIALAEIRVGTDASETLTGTNSADQITGKGGNDTLKGLAGNDTYHFDDLFGQDTLTETAIVKVGKKKLPGGIDTLNFSQVSSGGLTIRMIPQWAELGYNQVVGPGGTVVVLGSSPVENAVGGSGNDIISGGSAKNTFKGGPGGSDEFVDYGGYPGDSSTPALAASDDTYKGFTSGTGTDLVIDFGGATDKLDLRPLESSDVYFDAGDADNNGTNESILVKVNDTTSIGVLGYFSPFLPGQDNGRIEQIIFSDGVVTNAASIL